LQNFSAEKRFFGLLMAAEVASAEKVLHKAEKPLQQ
jgi:phosphoglycerate kinase